MGGIDRRAAKVYICRVKAISHLLIVAIACLFVSPSCSKKSSNPNPSQTCQIITVTDQNGTTATTYHLTYNNAGQISTEKYSIGGVVYTRVFTYTGNTEIMTTLGGPAPITDSITLNSDGLIQSDYYSEAYNRIVTTYTYSGAEVQTMITRANDGSTPDTTTYTWTNGDLTGSTLSGSGTTFYTYYITASEPGDYWSVIQLINNGGYFLKTVHQLASNQLGSTIVSINYTYDNTGKVTLVSVTNGGNVETFSFQYACH
jgi:hypothetical protein